MNNAIVPGFDQDEIPQLKIILKQFSGAPKSLFCSLYGQLDTWNSNTFQRRMGLCFMAGFSTLVFDMSKLTYVSSTGVGAFVQILKDAKTRSGTVILANILPNVFEVFQLLGFPSFFTIVPKLSDAVPFLLKNKEAPAQVVTPSALSIFPRVMMCPICQTRLKVPKAGRFFCGHCKTRIQITETGEIFLI